MYMLLLHVTSDSECTGHYELRDYGCSIKKNHNNILYSYYMRSLIHIHYFKILINKFNVFDNCGDKCTIKLGK